MPILDSQKFYKELEKKTPSPLYFLFGDDPYLIEQAYLRIKHEFLDPMMLDFNYDQFYGLDSEVEKIIDAVETLPMMAQHRFVVLKEAHALNDKEWLQLEKVFTHSVESTVFVILAEKIDKRKKAIKTLIDKSIGLECKRPYNNQIPQWVNYIALQYDLKLNNECIQLIHKRVGDSLIEIDAEIKKLALYVGDKKTVTSEDVQNVISFSKEESVFELTKSVGKKNRALALENLINLVDQGQSEVGIVTILARHLRLLLKINKGLSEGLSGNQLAAEVQVSPYFIEESIAQARKWTDDEIQKGLADLSQIDKSLKSSPIRGPLLLEKFILTLKSTEQ